MNKRLLAAAGLAAAATLGVTGVMVGDSMHAQDVAARSAHRDAGSPDAARPLQVAPPEPLACPVGQTPVAGACTAPE